MNLTSILSICHEEVDKIYSTYLIKPIYPDKQLQETMLYAVQNGGKRIRPLLVFAVGAIFLLEKNFSILAAPAAAIELIHTYSLIHDDLPAMDNADLRRGKPSCHKAFNEALAILAGDALQPLAFEIMASHPSTLSANQRLAIINLLSHASGVAGMAAGQSMDLTGGNNLSLLERMYHLKTGALITAAVEISLIACEVKNEMIKTALHAYIYNIGFAFQIQDDLLDLMGDEAIIGKPVGLDANNKKFTYPSLIGLKPSQDKIKMLFENALLAIKPLGNDAEILHELAYYLLQRKK